MKLSGPKAWFWSVACWAALCAHPRAAAQVNAEFGTVSGVAVDTWLGSPLPGVIVSVRGTTLAVVTDVEGRYTLKQVPTGERIVVFSKSGYARASVTDVRVLANQVSKVDIRLRPEFYEMEEYEVTVEELEEQEVELLIDRQKASSISDAIGSEQFSKYGASDAKDIMSKVAGASIVEGKFAVIRGLSDRYTSATLNGAEIPTADPYRKAAQLDLFPAALIDRVVVSKSFTPDQPGSFTGGAIDIVTRSFPQKFQFSASVGMSYNTQASLNDDFLSYPGGSYDWAGVDDGTRDVPPELEGGVAIPPPPLNAKRADGSAEAAARQMQAEQLAAYSRAFRTTTFGGTKDESPVNHDFSISIGDTVKLFNRPFGYFGGLSYKHEYEFYENGIQGRYGTSLQPTRRTLDTLAVSEVSWGSVVNLAYQLHPDHELSFTFFYNQSAEDRVRHQEGRNYLTGSPDQTLVLNELHWTERNLNAFQFRGKHHLPPVLDMRLDWLVSLANTSQNEPDLRYFNYYRSPDGLGGFVNAFDNSLPEPRRPTRYFRNLEEDNRNIKIDDTIPFPQWSGLTSELKVGVYQSTAERTFEERTFFYEGVTGFREGQDPNTYLDPDNLGFTTTVNSRGQTNYIFNNYIRSELGNNRYAGNLEVQAAYAMLDLPLVPKMRVIGGMRYETTDLEILSTGPSFPNGVRSTIEGADYLPAAALVYNIITNMNLRLSYGKTLARPTFREIAGVRAYDTTGDEILEGNPDLQRTLVDNYDIRWEWFPHPGEVLAVSAFYKDLTAPIEKFSRTISGDIITYVNRDKAQLYGVEFEARKTLDFLDPALENFTLGANVALIQSVVELTPAELFNKREVDPDVDETRPLYDQSPYIINLDLTYANRKSGTTVTLAANLSGERIYIATGAGPDIYEHPPTTLDLVISQRLGKHWRMKLSAKNLLDPVYDRTYGSGDSEFIYSRYRKGRVFGISLGCDF